MSVFSRVPKRMLGILALLTGLVIGQAASASTIYTFGFQQTGLDVFSTPAIESGTLSGTFSGTVDSLGIMSLADLTSFHLEINGLPGPQPNFSSSSLPYLFGFHVGDPSSLTFIELTEYVPHLFLEVDYCMGAAAGFVCNGGNARGVLAVDVLPGSDRLFALAPTLVSNSAPTVALVSTTPIPAAGLLFATALGGIGALGAVRRRKSARSPLFSRHS
jgi:hypothetical protein